MIVAISMRVVEAQGYSEPRDAVSHALVSYVTGLGATPLLVPNAGDVGAWLSRMRFDRLLLSGGEDIVSDVAGPLDAIGSARDRAERLLLDHAMSKGIPVLGICRGAMMINLRLGGRITSDLANAVGEKHVAASHEVRLWDGRSVITNSYHNQGIVASQLAPGLQPLAITRAGVVEAFKSPQANALGVLWHPERPGSAVDVDRHLFSQWLA